MQVRYFCTSFNLSSPRSLLCLPLKKGGFGNLGEAIRRLNEQQGMMPQPIPRAERMPDQSTLDKFRQVASRPNPFVRSNAPSFNPTIFGQPIGDIDFSNMPDFSQMDLTNLQVPTDMPMAQDLPEVAPIGMMPQMRMGGMQPRMMMQEGEDVSLERELFSLQAQLENLQKQLQMDRSYNDDQAVINTSAEMAAIQKRMQEILQESGRTMSDLDKALMGGRTMSDMDKGRTTSNMDRQMAVSNFLEQYGLTVPREVVEKLSQESGFSRQSILEIIQEGGRTISDSDYNMSRPQLAGGGEPFPDLSGDGQITRKDILMGQGVKFKAEGGEMMTQENEIDAMLGGMDSEEAGAMEDLEQMAPEMEMIDQLVTMVVQMIQQGASEEEVIMFLREQGLDDEDIGTVLQLVAEMAEAEAMPQDGIGAELEQLA
jgi:hypothetical protein